jgi:hypothetical protein
MNFLKRLGRFLFWSALVAHAVAVGVAAAGVIGFVFSYGLAGRPPRGPDPATWALLGLILDGLLLGAVAVFMACRNRAARGGRPAAPALPEAGPRWADRHGAGRHGIAPGAERGEYS